MKKFLLTIGIVFSLFTMPAHADKTTNKADVQRHTHNIPDKIHRSPSVLPTIEVMFDSDTNTIEITSSMYYDADIKIYDASGNLIASSDLLNTVIYLSDSNHTTLYIYIYSDNWYATANINI